MQAKTFNCLNCGAAVSCDSPVCRHCGARVATMACPACFTMNLRESKFCSQCGEPTVLWQPSPGLLPCPACDTPLLKANVGDVEVCQCSKCFGFWVDRAMFERITRKARAQAIAPAFEKSPAPGGPPDKIRYVRCPGCRQLMNRVNYAEYSGIVVDICREHGTWFEKNELQAVVHFLRNGGLEQVQDRKQRELKAARRRLESARPSPAEAMVQPLFQPDSSSRVDVFPELVRLLGNVFRRP